ncbi:hypothetical protein L9F63_014678, partial [Diploptera punctata]
CFDEPQTACTIFSLSSTILTSQRNSGKLCSKKKTIVQKCLKYTKRYVTLLQMLSLVQQWHKNEWEIWHNNVRRKIVWVLKPTSDPTMEVFNLNWSNVVTASIDATVLSFNPCQYIGNRRLSLFFIHK